MSTVSAKESKVLNPTIEIINQEGLVRSYLKAFEYYSGGGRVLIRGNDEIGYMVDLQDQDKDPTFAERFKSQSNAESFAKWMALGL